MTKPLDELINEQLEASRKHHTIVGLFSGLQHGLGAFTGMLNASEADTGVKVTSLLMVSHLLARLSDAYLKQAKSVDGYEEFVNKIKKDAADA